MATTIIINYYFKSDLVLTLILIFWSARIPSLHSMAFYRALGDKKLGTRCLQCFNPCWAGFTYSRQGKYDSRRAKKLGSAQFYCNSAGSGFLECGPDRSFKPHLKTEQFLKKKKSIKKTTKSVPHAKLFKKYFTLRFLTKYIWIFHKKRYCWVRYMPNI